MTAAMFLPFLRNDKIPLRVRKKLGKLTGSPSPDNVFQVRLFDAVFEGKTGNHQDDKIYLYGSHEPATLRLLRDILAHNVKNGIKPVYLDIGTNVGQHLIAVAGLAKDAYGFEPWESVRERAVKNLALNNFTHAKIMPYGLSDEAAMLPYFPPASGNLGIGSFRAEAEDNAAAPVTLEVRRGDDVIEEMGIAPSLLKIDTEGFESNVLRGLKNTLEKFRPAVVFELSDLSRKDFSSLESIKTFFPTGYGIYGILRSREYPRIVPYSNARKFENLLACADEKFPF